MGRRNKKYRKGPDKPKKKRFELPLEIKQMILGILMILFALIVGLSFFNLAGRAGSYFISGAKFLIGNTIFLVPLIFILGGLVFLNAKENRDFLDKSRKVFWPVALATLILLIGATGVLGSLGQEDRKGGLTGYVLSWPFLKYFGFWVTQLVFIALIIIGGLIFWYFLKFPAKEKKEETKIQAVGDRPAGEEKLSIIKKIFAPKFKVEEIPHFEPKDIQPRETDPPSKFEKNRAGGGEIISYEPPPLNLLEAEKGAPLSGDTKVNSSIIQKTLQNFNIDITMSEVNIGPTVTQYAFKPAEGVKLSKITGLSNDLALALASHPIRIEAPIPGRSLVGIEVPNKVRAEVRLRNLIENEAFQKSDAYLNIVLGRDVSGVPVYTDLTKMPHFLVAGSTGAGKTIFLNTLILSLLYQPSTIIKSAGPETLRLILVDPKRVEFPVYSNMPHLLCPILYTANQTLGALRWLTGEMERRFEVLAEAKSRNIASFNEKALKGVLPASIKEGFPLPFIIVVIDELADLMAAKGREIEAGIVRLAQMARAVGIHLVVATQRPSVEIITGLIKANITSRVTFKVASQIDSRTIIDSSGAEKLLGGGDLLYISSSTPKPKRIQGAYVSEKEVRRVVNYIIEKKQKEGGVNMNDELIGAIERGSEDFMIDSGTPGIYSDADSDPLFEEAKRIVVESRRASASLLQRRLRVGYARAARLIDMLEEEGVVGPADGAKPREIIGPAVPFQPESEDRKDADWEKL